MRATGARRGTCSSARRDAGFTVVLFFTLLAAAHGLRLAALVGLALCAAEFSTALLKQSTADAPSPQKLRRAGAPKPR